MAGKKRRIEDGQILSRPELLVAIKGMSGRMEKRNKALASFIYLSGCRISEIVGCTKVVKKYMKENGRYVKDEYNQLVWDKYRTVKVRPLIKESVEIIEDRDIILIHDVPNLKRRSELPRRTIPIIYSKEKPFCDMFLDYFYDVPDKTPLFPITRERSWQILNSELALFNHFLIHERCNHLVTRMGFTDLDLKQFRGWSNTVPAQIYSHLRWQDLATKMRG